MWLTEEYCCVLFRYLVYNTIIGEILNSMLGYIGLPSILQKIIQVCCPLKALLLEYGMYSLQ